MKAARVAEHKKEVSYTDLDLTSHDFLALALDVFGGLVPRADEFLRQLASFAVTRRSGFTEGPQFSKRYSVILHKWRTRLSVILNREIANAITEGARNARGERDRSRS